MKKIIALGLVCMLTFTVKGQFLDRLKNKVQRKAEDAVDKQIDKTIDNAGKKKDKDPAGNPTTTSGNTEDAGTAATGAASAAAGPNLDITSYSKFDFIPGAKVIVQEDFSQDAIGDFPAQWNTRTGAEVVTVSNRPGKWLAINKDGIFYPEYVSNSLPDNFTLQVDVMANNNLSNIGTLTIGLLQTQDTDDKFDMGPADRAPSKPGFKVGLAPVSSGHGYLYYSSNLIGGQHINGTPEFHVPGKNVVTVSIWRQKQRIRVYLDSTKTLDLPRALDPAAALNSLVFNSYAPDLNKEGGTFYISNIRLAVGAPDTRNKLITEGKFTTHGILFDVNSDKVQAASYGTLKDIANVLSENAAVRVKIIGHTDTDGDTQANLDLSKRRAAAVKTALTESFGIDAARMETDGKGEAQPVDNNDTPAAKANNRRVEFIKL